MTIKPDFAIAAHEAAHAVAAYILGLSIDKITVEEDRGATKVGGRSSEDPFTHGVALLAADAYMRSIGVPSRGTDGDIAKARVLVHTALDYRGGPAAVSEAFAVLEEAAAALVGTDRFQLLVAQLTKVLVKSYWHFGPRVLRFLKEHDPERVESHSVSGSVEGASFEVRDSRGRMVYSGTSYATALATHEKSPHSRFTTLGGPTGLSVR